MPLNFNPPLLNSATPWATTRDDLQALYDCRYTGALTIRTCMTDGYPHDDQMHQYCFADTEHSIVDHSANGVYVQPASGGVECISSLNTFVYSPIPLAEYLDIVRGILSEDQQSNKKPIIFSVAGSISQIREYYSYIHSLNVATQSRLLMEVNLACPNIAGKPPPAYSEHELTAWLQALAAEIWQNASVKSSAGKGLLPPLEIGLKAPPYIYRDQFKALIAALRAVQPSPISFITTTNTLGSCLLLSTTLKPVLNSEAGTGIGGLAGAALHPLALGNVQILRTMLNEHEELKHVSVIGVGGVSDQSGYRRMLAVGAEAVGVGTALGSEGLGVFRKILHGVENVDQDIRAALDGESPGPAKRLRLDIKTTTSEDNFFRPTKPGSSPLENDLAR